MIKIFNDKIVHIDHRNKKRKISIEKLPMYFSDKIILDENLTFEDFMNHLNKIESIIDFIFAGSLGFNKFKDFYEDMKKPMAIDQKDGHLTEYLEVYYYPDLFKYKENEPYELSSYFGFHMIKLEDGKDEKYSISFSQLSDFKNHLLKLSHNVEYFLNDTTKEIIEYKSAFTAKLDSVSVFNFIHAILDEISWHGSPKSRNKRSKKLLKTVSDIEKGKIKLIPFDDAINSL